MFAHTRPHAVLEERTSDASLDVNAQRSAALHKYSSLQAQSGNVFLEQWKPEYPAQAFPFTFPHVVGGPEYDDRQRGRRAVTTELPGAPAGTGAGSSKRQLTCPVVSSKAYTRGVARRVEMQIRADWVTVPALRNLDFRHTMMRTASLKVQEEEVSAEALQSNAKELCEAAGSLYHRLWHGYCRKGTKRRRINGDTTLLRYAENLTDYEKQLLRNLGYIGRKLAGSQHIRLRMGHALFGARVSYGDGAFFTISPSERHCGLTLRLSRCRRNDVWLTREEDSVEAHRALAGAERPALEGCREPDEEEVGIEIPEYDVRRTMIVRDGLAPVEAFKVLVIVVLARLLGVRMCPLCPRCNAEGGYHPCQDQFGSNMRPCGGIFGG